MHWGNNGTVATLMLVYMYVSTEPLKQQLKTIIVQVNIALGLVSGE